MKQLLSPKQVAASVGVSESSLKRWCDQGLIPIERTPGGHRRIRLRDAVQFIRERGNPVVQPEQLGLPTGVAPSVVALAECVQPLTTALDTGDANACRRIVFDAYLGGASMARLCDDLLTPAMHRLGDAWQCGRLEIFQERRACELVNQLIFELRAVVPRTKQEAAIAIGGTLEGDHYRLATLMVSLALTEIGWDATSLGTGLPLETLVKAIDRQAPRLFWLSISQVDDAEKLPVDLAELASKLPATTELVLGGQAIHAGIAKDLDRVTVCDSLADLQQHARTLAD